MRTGEGYFTTFDVCDVERKPFTVSIFVIAACPKNTFECILHSNFNVDRIDM